MQETMIVHALTPEDSLVAAAQAAALLREGQLVVFPTETVYGLGANALDGEAVKGIFRAKGRPQDNPLIAHIADLEGLAQLTGKLPPQAMLLAQAFWPGPFTMVLPKSSLVPDAVSAGLDTVGVRMPSSEIAREIIRQSGVPIAAPSANISGKPSPTRLEHCMEDLKGKVSMMVDGGACPVGVESTVLSLAGNRPRLLRPGGVTLEQLYEVLGDVDVDPAVFQKAKEGEAVASPGMKYKHYAPSAEVTLVHGSVDAFTRFVEEHKGEGVFALAFEEDLPYLPLPAVRYGSVENAGEQAARLFDALRKLDMLGAKTVYAHAPSKEGIGLAVYNRLVRAAAFRELFL